MIKVTMEQAKTNKDKTVDSRKDPLFLMEFEADINSHVPIERSSFYMSQLQNLTVVYFGNQETDDRKKVFDKYYNNNKIINALQERGMAPNNGQVHSVVEEK